MGTFQAIADESESYLEENVDIEIVDVEFATGEALNVGETATFKVKVTNRGLLNMDDVIVRVSGQNGALVKSPNAAAEFTDEFDIGTFDTITGDGGGQLSPGGVMSLKAPSTAQASKVLVKATIHQWNWNWDRIQKAHSPPTDPPKGTFAAEVIAQ